LVDRIINRPLAGPLVRLFVKWGISPNVVTGMSLTASLSAAVCFLTPGYGMALLGALLFQLAAVLDCCDGDVARSTGTTSKFGERLDLLSDNLSYAAVFLTLGWAGSEQADSWMPMAAGVSATIGSSLSIWMIVSRKLLETHRSTVPPVIHAVANRDFSIALILFTAVEAQQVFLILAAIGSNGFLIASLYAVKARASGDESRHR
jgi:phosphatidylglycerophosphate synthase